MMLPALPVALRSFKEELIGSDGVWAHHLCAVMPCHISGVGDSSVFAEGGGAQFRGMFRSAAIRCGRPVDPRKVI